MNRDNKPWFAPKRYGIGAGLPIAWQGWALMIAYIVIVSVTAPFAMLIPYFLYHNWWIATPPFIGVMLIETGVFMVICARKTRGGCAGAGVAMNSDKQIGQLKAPRISPLS